ncbi:MAG: DUF4278 domain-containing protein [Prochlorothrix sp.]
MTCTFRGQRYEAAALVCPYFTVTKYRGTLTIVHHDPAIVSVAPASLTYRGCPT